MRASIAESAIDAVIDRYRRMIYGIALTHTRNLHDAEDAFQQTFLIYLEKNPAVRDEEHRKAWLIRTAIHCCRKITGSTWRKKTVPLDNAPEASFTFASRAENDVYQAVRALPAPYRSVVYLFYFAGESTAEIAAALRISGAAVRTRLVRARKLLKSQLEGDYFDES